ncbi:MAG: DUF2157 domain-containing protein [Bacteroidetes bacterium]|nr:DUF2157 domain-containing protein [Bacteroidota bacterium]
MGNAFDKREVESLWSKRLITDAQHEQIKDYRSKNIFSLRYELRGLLYLSVLLFTTGAGMLIYKNLDSIGHTAILLFLLLVTLICFYYSYLHSKGFSTKAVSSDKPLYDYAALAANILAGIFIGYLQYQYHPFGDHYPLATLAPTILYFFCAYYFDHKGILSLAITGLIAFVGFSISPADLLNGDFFSSGSMSFAAILLGYSLGVWTYFAEYIDFKKHFNETYLIFALHLLCIVSIGNLFSGYWYLYLLVLINAVVFFIWKAYERANLNFLFFSVVYGYIGLNILLVRFITKFNFSEVIIYLTPFYFGASIIFFIKWLKDFKKRTKYVGVQ